jgi:hypothetical protein
VAILERRVQKGVKEEKAYQEWEQKWQAIEERLGGFPAKRHYYLLSGSDDSGTMVWEREWDSFAAMEAAYDRLFAVPEAQSLGASVASIYAGERTEYYIVT